MKDLALAVGGCLLLVTGCSTSRVMRPPGPPGAAISPSERICVAVPDDGRYETHVYTGSGRIVATRVAHALQKRYPNVDVLTGAPEADPAAACRAKGGRYLVLPTLLHWEDRATAWSTLPDRIEVEVALRDLDSDASPRRIIFENHTSEFGNVGEFGNFPPQRLLNSEFDEAVLELATGGSP